MKFFKLFKSFDILTSNEPITIRNNSKFKSPSGGIISLLILIFITTCLLSTIFTFTNPNNYYQTIEEPLINENFKLEGSKYNTRPIALMVPSTLLGRVKLKKGYFKNNTAHNEYMEECDKEYLVTNFPTFNQTFALKSYHFYCFDFNDYQIEAGRDFIIYEEDCKKANETELDKLHNKGEPCLDNNETLSSTFMQLITKESGMTNNKTNPFNYRDTSFPLHFSNKMYNMVTMNIVIESIQQDNGWLFSSITEYLDFNLVKDDKTFIYREKESSFPNAYIRFKISDTYKQINRRYVKLPEMLGIIGGFLYVFIFVLGLFSKIIGSYLIDCYLIDEFVGDCFSKQYKSEYSRAMLNITNNNITDSNLSFNSKDKIPVKRKKIAFLTYMKINAKNLFNKKSNQISYLERCVNHVQIYRDYTYLIHKIREIEIIKKIFLDQKQILAFSFIYDCLGEVDGRNDFLSKKQKLIDYFTTMKKQETMGLIDENLFNLLSEDLREEIYSLCQ
jgi:hypothetical protein